MRYPPRNYPLSPDRCIITAHVWRPIISDARRDELLGLTREIVDAVTHSPIARLGDAVDRAILRAQLAHDDTVPEPEDAAGEALARGVAMMARGAQPLGLFGGVAGLGWVGGKCNCCGRGAPDAA